MRTVIPYSNLRKGSWTEDLTPSQEIRQKFMYVQCMGHYYADSHYGVINRSGLRSYLLLYTNSGEGIIEYHSRRVSLPEHCSVILDCNDLHSYYSAANQDWELYWIHFCGTGIDGYLNNIMENWDVNTTDITKDFFQRIYDYCHRDLNISDSIQCSTDIINVCSQFLISLRKGSQNSPIVKTPLIRSAMSYMEEHIGDAFSLDELCSYLNISKFYLAHSFKTQTGFSPTEYLITLRLSNAKSMLRCTSIPIGEIAERCGFNSSSYFIQTFKKKEGITPLAYRKYFLQIDAT
jgi:AraC-like DNA-binding protein